MTFAPEARVSAVFDFAFVRAGDPVQLAALEPASAGGRRRLVLAGPSLAVVPTEPAGTGRLYAFARRGASGAFSVVGRPLIYQGDVVQLWLCSPDGFSVDPSTPAERGAVGGVDEFAVGDAGALPLAVDWMPEARAALAGTDPDRPQSKPLPPGARAPLHFGAPFVAVGSGSAAGRPAGEWVEFGPSGAATWTKPETAPPPASRWALSPLPAAASPDWRELAALAALLSGPLASRSAGGQLRVACVPEARGAAAAAAGAGAGLGPARPPAFAASLATWTAQCQLEAEEPFFRAQTGVAAMAEACPAQQRMDHQLCYWDDGAMAFGCTRRTDVPGCGDAEFAGGSPVLDGGGAGDVTAARYRPLVDAAAAHPTARPSLVDALRNFAGYVAALVRGG